MLSTVSVTASAAKPSPTVICHLSAAKQSPTRHLSWRAQRSNLPLRTCHCERSEAISYSAPVIASAAKQSPFQFGDCFSRKERSFAMTIAGCHPERSEAISYPALVIASAAKQSPFQLPSLRAQRSNLHFNLGIASVAANAPSQ
ncbi:MAG: hypothetical protein ACPL4H_06145 [Anaerolineales bacterium]